MKKLFYFSAVLLIIFEIANVYFIMPMPGSQEMNSIGLAYFLHSFRWVFRIGLGLSIFIGFIQTWETPGKWVRILTLIPVLGIIYSFNYIMTADKMFLQPSELILKGVLENKVPTARIIIGIELNGEAKAYPVEYLAYHHQVQDKIAGKDVIVTYCSVCRTGRVFEPTVEGKVDKFRLVGMDHFNAMFEDERTGSWWRQVNGEAIAGHMKGKRLPEIQSFQMSLEKWLELYPYSMVMQPDPASIAHYDEDAKYEKGESKGSLTGTNPDSWQPKSWVIGIEIGRSSRAYDWNYLKEHRMIKDSLGGISLILILSVDEKSFTAFQIPPTEIYTLSGDTLSIGKNQYNFRGVNINNKNDYLKRISSYQEFWHSWQTFHPNTSKYN